MLKSLHARLSGKTSPMLSIIVVAYNMAREIERTLQSLASDYQQSIGPDQYEVIVVDNGSSEPLTPAAIERFGPQFQLLRIDDALPSPAQAINRAAEQARGQQLGIIIDGARMLSPGVLHWALQAFRLTPDAIVSALGFHLGPEHQRESSQRGYGQALEDELLQRIDWPNDGYRLFEIACLAGSSRFGWHAPLAESNCLFVTRDLFDALGGYEERFTSPGGGLVNLDFYKRACETPDTTLYYLVGEGCFHQWHGGVTTGGAEAENYRYHHLQEEYESVRGKPHRVPQRQPVLLGTNRPAAVWLVARGSAELARNNQLEDTRRQHFAAIGLPCMEGL